MRVTSAFPSRFLKAADLNGRRVEDTIVRVTQEMMNREEKPVVHFQNNKPLVLNKTNATTIASTYGDEMGDWGGAIVELVPTQVEFQGRLVDSVRTRVPPRKLPAKPSHLTPASDESSVPDEPPPDYEFDDPIEY